MIYAIIIVLLRNGNCLNALRVILLLSIRIKFIFFGMFLLYTRVFMRVTRLTVHTEQLFIN
jgi:hypothetical protein